MSLDDKSSVEQDDNETWCVQCAAPLPCAVCGGMLEPGAESQEDNVGEHVVCCPCAEHYSECECGALSPNHEFLTHHGSWYDPPERGCRACFFPRSYR